VKNRIVDLFSQIQRSRENTDDTSKFQEMFHYSIERRVVIMRTLIILSFCVFLSVESYDFDKLRNQSCNWDTTYPERYLSVFFAPVPECQPSCTNGKMTHSNLDDNNKYIFKFS
jgi:hypothetical protein